MDTKEHFQERKDLHKQIWQIADELRGAIDGWDFKQYVLGMLFYRFISENLCEFINENEGDDFDYASLGDEAISPEIRKEIVNIKGFFIYPSELFCNMHALANDPDLNIKLTNALKNIENSCINTPAESRFRGLFADLNFSDKRLGSTHNEKIRRISSILKGIASCNLHASNSNIDAFGDAYEFLISNYASNAGKSGGEFFTPQYVSTLLSKIVSTNRNIKSVYDPTCGSGSLLLAVKRQNPKTKIKYYGQELNSTTFNLARMNMFLHNVNYNDFHIEEGDTLIHPAKFQDEKSNEIKFDAIVSNPPYSVKWIGSDDATLINDPRFSPAGVLAPKNYADLAFIMHSSYFLAPKAKAAIVCFPGIFYRKGAELKIRKYLLNNDFIKAVIALPENLFFGTSIATCILVLENKNESKKVRFINATELYKKETNNNVLTDEFIEQILAALHSDEEIKHFATSVDVSEIIKNDCNLSVSSYVAKSSSKEIINIDELNAEIKGICEKSNELRCKIDEIFEGLENE